MTKPKPKPVIETATDTLVPDPQVRAELAISPMTLRRWDDDPEMTEIGWPPIIRMVPQGRKYRSRRLLENFKANLLKRAVEQRGR